MIQTTNETNTTISWAQDDAALGLALVFSILLLAAGFKDKTFWLAAGPVWLICGMTIFINYGSVFMFISVGLGIVLMLWGGFDAFKHYT